MIPDNFSPPAYFERIGFTVDAPTGPDIGFVAAMMRAQWFAMPFENLHVQAGKGVPLVPQQIVDKIIVLA